MKGALMLSILIMSQTIAGFVMLVLSHAWIALDPGVVNEVLPAIVVGLIAIGASLLLPLGILRRGRNG